MLQIASRWWTGEAAPIKPSKWFQVHHKNFQHFDNQLENLEYVCGNCHGQKGKLARKRKSGITLYHGVEYVRALIDYLQTRGLFISYVFLSKAGVFSWAVIGPRQD